jgi:4-hydroxybenzoate polyprenyltransferase
VSSARRAGYRLFGSKLDYFLHTRPAEWPIMAAHTLLGYLLAVGLEGARAGEHLGAAVLGLCVWVVCLNGGTLALNSAHDRDEGDIAYLRQPPPPPRHLAAFGLAMMFIGLLVAFALPVGYRVAYAICLVLSVLYSAPPARLKSVPGADWVINMWGFGTLTPYAGWATTGLRLDPAHGLVLLGFCPLFAALYPLTQIYQFDEDSRRGDRTLARSLGIKWSLVIALGAIGIAFWLFSRAGVVAGWGNADAGRWLVLGFCATIWVGLLLIWLSRYRRMSARDHQGGMYQALGAWALTDMGMVLIWSS